MERDLLPKAIVVIVVGVAFLAFALGVSLESPGPPAAPQPLSVIAFWMEPFPGGPALTIELQSSTNSSIDNLSAQLLVQAAGYESQFTWLGMYLRSPNISAADPLQPGQVATFGVGGNAPLVASCGATYFLTVAGTYSYGASFVFVTSQNLSCPR
jgi:hypothetical protein